MVFSGLAFIYYFLPVVLILYFISDIKIKNAILLVSGLIFYAWGEPFYLIIMLLSTAIDYTAGRMMDKYNDDDKKRKLFLLVSVCMNVGLLAIFKYSDFIFDSINSLTGAGLTNPVLLVNKGLNRLLDIGLSEDRVKLPIGISFFTFQSMSYTIDLYRRKIGVQKSFLAFAAYISMFPQIVAGPIVRYETVADELEHRNVNASKISTGISLFIKGLAKKVLLADNIGMMWAEVKAMDYSTLPVLTAWLGILAYTFEIYFDFSGYSDMAKGLGKMLGFSFPENFDHPYVSRSISEFWRRWHITLGSWFREYVYIPLGGNRNGTLKTCLNLLIVWGLTGLWHGADWNFIIWGLYFGIIIICERLFLGKLLEKLPKFIAMAYQFFLVIIGWVFFDTDGPMNAISYLGAMFGANNSLADTNSFYLLRTNLIILAVCAFASTELVQRIYSRIKRKTGVAIRYVMPVIQTIVFIVCTAYITDATFNFFMYFRF